MNSYDIIIAGGGMAGLYAALNLCKKYKILILEKNNYLGGRLYTYKNPDLDIQYEAGGARFSENHKLLFKLINKLGLIDDIVKISNNKTPLTMGITYENKDKLNSKYDLDDNITVQSLIDKVIELSTKNFSNNFLRTLTFINLCKHVLPNNEVQFIEDCFGYYGELYELNSYDAIRMLSNDFNDNIQFYILKNGITSLCDKIREYILYSGNVEILLNSKVINFDKNQLYRVYTKEQVFFSNNLILALPREPLMSFPILSKNIGKILRSVKPNPLCRIYAIYPKDSNNKVWFDDLGKITTDNPLQYIIPINKDKGLIMITYSDMSNAKFWNSIEEKDINTYLEKYLKEIFPNRNIPQPVFIKKHFWRGGVYYYRPGYDSNKIYKKILKPFSDNLFIIGECYSQNQAWIEGSLDSVEKMLRYF